MELREYKLGELLDVTRGASLSGEYYAKEGELIRLTLGHFDYVNGGFKENTSKDNLYFIGDVKEEFILNEGDIIAYSGDTRSAIPVIPVHSVVDLQYRRQN